MFTTRRVDVHGHVAAGFEGVRAACEENFARRHELGSACCVVQRGVTVVDLWGGVRRKASQAPWEVDTLALVYSATKGLSAVAEVLARQKPAWEPGTRQAHHAISLGFYQGELMRRIDAQHRSLGQFFRDEIATPLGLDFYIRLPESIPDSRLATLEDPSPIEMLMGIPSSPPCR